MLLVRVNVWLGKKKARSFCVPSKWAKSGVQHGLFSPCPVTLRSSSSAPSSGAVSIHPALTPRATLTLLDRLRPRQITVSKLLSTLHQPFLLISTPIPWRGVFLSTNTSATAAFHLQGHWRVPMKVTAVRSLHERSGFTLLPKQPLHHQWGGAGRGTRASLTLDPPCWRFEGWNVEK